MSWRDKGSNPGGSQEVVVPDSAADLPGGISRGLLTRTAGTVAFVAERDGTSVDDATAAAAAAVTYAAVPAYTYFPIRVRRVLATTTAEVVAVY